MDSDLSDLIAAVRDAPRSEAVLGVLLRAARETSDSSEVASFVAGLEPGQYEGEATRLRAGVFLMEFGFSEAALGWFSGDSVAAGIHRARAHLALGDKASAAQEYRTAVARDPAQRDKGLDEALSVIQVKGTESAAVFDLSGRRIEQGDVPHSAPVIQPAAARDRVTFADVGGHDDVKRQINRKIVLPFTKPSLFQRFRKKSGGGVLMFGPPGCGKTLLARATAGECGAKFLPLHIHEILDMYFGQSEKNLAAAFEQARQHRPTVLFLDEIEALAARRKYVNDNSHSTLVSTFLSEMDGVSASNDGVLVLAATNIPWAIDSAFRRPGRFDRVIFVPPPDEAARHVILQLHMRERPRVPELDLKAIAARTPGFSGADLSGLVENAVELAIEDSIREDDIEPLNQRHFMLALEDMRPSTLDWLSSARNYAKYANEGGLYDDVAAFLDKHGK